MSLGAIHPLPARQLIRDVDERRFDIDDGESVIFGPYLCRGYAWCVGHIRQSGAGGNQSTLDIYQGFEDRSQIGAVPLFGRWLTNNSFNVAAGAPGATTTWKVVVVDTLIYFEFTNSSGALATIEFDTYLRND